MSRGWAHEIATHSEGLIVITNGTIYKAVSPEIYQIAGYQANGWYVDEIEVEAIAS